MPEQPSPTTGLPEPVRELLAAIEAALTVPVPAVGEPDNAHLQLLDIRAGWVLAAIRGLLKDEHPDATFDADYIRKRTAATPITYTPWVDPKGGRS